jgi:hypothetical protein
METEGSLLFSQKLFTGPYPEPDDSSAYHPSYFSEVRFYIILPFISISF